MVRAKIAVDANVHVQKRRDRNHEPDRLHVAQPFLVIENCGVLRHFLPCYGPQINEPDGLDALRTDLVHAVNALRFGLEFIV